MPYFFCCTMTRLHICMYNVHTYGVGRYKYNYYLQNHYARRSETLQFYMSPFINTPSPLFGVLTMRSTVFFTCTCSFRILIVWVLLCSILVVLDYWKMWSNKLSLKHVIIFLFLCDSDKNTWGIFWKIIIIWHM